MDIKICVALFTLYLTAVHAQCPSGWKSLAGKCIFIDDTQSTWPNAEQACISKGGSLLQVADKGLKDAINSELPKRSKTGFWWTGLTKSTNTKCEPNWRWNDDPNSDISNVKWLKEPNNMNGQEHCIEILKNGLSNDDNCMNRRGYICKFVSSTTKCDHDWVRGGPNCYYISTRSDTTRTDWNTARSLCQKAKQGADLMWIDNPAEATWLKDLITKLWTIRGSGNSRGWWIGANDLPNGDKGPYKWNDGQQSVENPEKYLEWDQEPTNAAGSTNFCGVMDGGVFYDGDCKGWHRFICQGNGQNCPDGWESGVKQCFFFGNEWKRWNAARVQCQQTTFNSQPAELVSITSPEILTFITQKMKEKNLGWVWTGLNDRDQGERCSPFTWADSTKPAPGIVTWATEPNSFGGVEHCGEILRNGVFNDANCAAKKPYICEAPLPAQRKKRQSTACPDGWLAGAGRCFKFTRGGIRSWDAQSQCRSWGSDLLNVVSSDVKTTVEDLVQKNPGNWWTGLKRDAKPSCTSKWRWLDEYTSDTKFITWEKEPNNLKGEEHCGEIWKDGVFNDASCTAKRGYICKYEMIPGTSACAPEFFNFGQSCYFFSTRSLNSMMTWADARADCDKRQGGSDLVWITSRSEYGFLAESVKSISLILPNKLGWWTGLNNGPNDNAVNWKWNDQTQLADTTILTWDTEPNNFNGNQLCATMRDIGAIYRARDCSSKQRFICQIPGTSSCPSSYSYDSKSNSCYYIEKSTRLEWAKARTQCQSQGADLVAINNDNTKNFVEQTLSADQSYKLYWVGLNDADQKSRCNPWEWRDGTRLNPMFIKWNQEPNNFDGNEHCVTMLQNGVMNDGNCDRQEAYICRYDLPASVSSPATYDVSGTNGKCLILTNWRYRDTDPKRYSWWWEDCKDTARALCEMPNPGTCPSDFTIQVDSSCYKIRGGAWTTHADNTAWCKAQNPAADLATIDNMAEAQKLGPLLFDAGATGFTEFSIKKWNGITACNQVDGNWRKRGNSCYMFSNRNRDGKSYKDARAECQKQTGGDLATFRNADEAEWLREIVGILWKITGSTPTSMTYRVGLDDLDIQGTWKWIDGTTFREDLVQWEKSPNDWDDRSSCNFIYKDGTYHTVQCGAQWLTGYICQKTVGGTGGPTTSCPFGWRERDGKCYLFSSKASSARLNWDDARKSCQNMMAGGELMSVENQDESEYIRDVTGLIWINDPKWPGWWTGLNDLPNGDKGPWKWTDGSEYKDSLIEWVRHPEVFGNPECTAVDTQGMYYAFDCTSRRSSICITGTGSGGPQTSGLSATTPGQKAGIAIGVIVLVALLAVLALVVYKMRTGPRPPKATGGIANILYGKEGDA
ncbi:unnamed protein product [Owenia fusiformis]|uniref:Uncharacterized protein n=1 Tax=Owenia fusiformis TaxID=6347 RepID=A0A8J1U4K9_OWEFU|nr:unnamed protein product [Owenia fusiformis]